MCFILCLGITSAQDTFAEFIKIVDAGADTQNYCQNAKPTAILGTYEENGTNNYGKVFKGPVYNDKVQYLFPTKWSGTSHYYWFIGDDPTCTNIDDSGVLFYLNKEELSDMIPIDQNFTHHGIACGAVSRATDATPPPLLYTPPHEDIEGETVNISWSDMGTSYKLYVSTDSNFNILLSGTDPYNVSGASKEITGLEKGMTYYFKVRRTSETEDSNIVKVITKPPAPLINDPSNINHEEFRANWNKVNGAAGYNLFVSKNNNFTPCIDGYKKAVGNRNYYTVTDLEPNTTYYYKVQGYNSSGGSGDESEIRSLKTAPPVPENLQTTNHTISSFTANWESSSGALGYYLRVYNETTKKYVDGYTDDNPMNVNAQFYQVSNLNTGKYSWRVKAENDTSKSDYSDPKMEVTLCPPKVIVKAATSISTTSFTANWGKVGVADKYYIDIKTNEGILEEYNNYDVGNNTSLSLTGLDSGRQYFYKVRAENMHATSIDSDQEPVLTSPLISTSDVSEITYNTSKSGGEASTFGDFSIDQRGLIWGISEDPTIESHVGLLIDAQTGNGSFDGIMSGLDSGQNYYVRSFITDTARSKTYYGENILFVPDMVPPGHALSFDGNNDYVSISDDADLDMTNNYTLEVWAKFDSVAGSQGLISKYQNSDANGYYFRLNDDELRFDNMDTENLNLSTDRWYHLAAVNHDGIRILYLDGVEIMRSDESTMTTKANNNELRIGSNFSGHYLNGDLDEVRIWNVVRGPDEIRGTMTQVLNGNEQGLVAYYRCDQLSGDRLVNKSSNRFYGQLKNMNDEDWIASEVPLGDESAYLYLSDWSGETLSLSHSDGDKLTLSDIAGNPTGIHLYRVDYQPVQTTPPQDWEKLSSDRYWGVFATGGTSPSSSITYYYSGHPEIDDEDQLKLAYRTNPTDNIWKKSGATLDTGAGILVKTGQPSQEYILGFKNYPTVETNSIHDITETTIRVTGNITNEGNASVTEKGVVWSRSDNPTLEVNEGRTYLSEGGEGSFDCFVEGLSGGEYYYIRSYATNNVGTTYGDSIRILTPMAPPGNVLTFDGIDDHVTFEEPVWSKSQESFTVEMWLDPADVTTRQRPFYHGENGEFQITIVNGKVYGSAKLSDEDWHTTSSSISADMGWYHVAVVWVKNTALTLYINGEVADINDLTDDNKGLYDPGESCKHMIGAKDTDTGAISFYNGSIDEVRIWDIPRADDEIKNHMNRVVNDNESGLLRYYRFDHMSGTILTDLIDGGHGTLNNMDDEDWTESYVPLANTVSDLNEVQGIWKSQTQSISSGGVILESNSITGQDYILTGYEGNLDKHTTGLPNTIEWRMERTWQIEVKGGTTGDLHLDTTGVDITGDESELVILVDDNGNFENGQELRGTLSGTTFTVTGHTFKNEGHYTLAKSNLPEVVTAGITDHKGELTADCGGQILTDGSATVTARGCVWGVTSGATIENNSGITDDINGQGEFISRLTGLVPGRFYYVRAYAVNSYGTVYGNEHRFLKSMKPPGNALAFDGQGRVIASGLPTDITNITLEAWVFHTELDEGIMRYITIGSEDAVIRYNNRALHFYLKLDGVLKSISFNNINIYLSVNEWSHVAGTWDGTSMKLYLNGKEISATTENTGTMSMASGNLCLSSENETLNGRLDEVRIWGRALSGDEIADNIHHELTGDESYLLAYYQFDHIEGSSLIDHTENGHDGTLYDMDENDWVSSTIPLADTISNRYNLRALWNNNLSNESGRMRIYVSDKTGPVELPDTDHVVFGHDNLSENQNTTDVPNDIKWRLNRTWKFEKEGGFNGDFFINADNIDNTDYPPSHLRLLVDSDGTFVNAVQYPSTSFDNNVIIEDAQLLDGHYYTIALSGLPEAWTGSPEQITHEGAVVKGSRIDYKGGDDITEHGICWSTIPSPTINDDHSSEGAIDEMEVFTSSTSQLSSGTTYYVRAYVTNSYGTAYGSEKTFTTIGLPIMESSTHADITATTATMGDRVTDTGGAIVTERGVIWTTSSGTLETGEPGVIRVNETGDWSVPSTFTLSVTGLSPNSTIRFRAYAINSAGISYGNEASLTTLKKEPAVTTNPATAIEIESTVLNATINAFNSDTIVNFEYGLTTAYGSTVSADPDQVTGLNSTEVQAIVTGLMPGTTYHYRVTGTSSAGSSVGQDMTFITLADTDNDGISDIWETENGLDPGNPDDSTDDTDKDGLTNLEEYQNGSNPNKEDSDEDGLSDKWEIDYGLDPAMLDSDDNGIPDNDEDPDEDGLTNLIEHEKGTDPTKKDTDEDGLSDKWELDNGFDPTLGDSNGDGISDRDEDPDEDGVDNHHEEVLGTDPNEKDSDNNGVNDGDEDPDGDGITTLDEIEKGLNPMVNKKPEVVIMHQNQTVAEEVLVSLNATGSSDPDDGISTYLWEQIIKDDNTLVLLSGTETAIATFTSPQVESGGESFIFKLTITDKSGQTASSECVVNVSYNNIPPTAEAGEWQETGCGIIVKLFGTATDADGTISSYSWKQTKGTAVNLEDSDTATPRFTSPVITVDETLEFTLTVTDDMGLIATDKVEIFVIANDSAGKVGNKSSSSTCFISAVSSDQLSFYFIMAGFFIALLSLVVLKYRRI
ncbi:MAG: hypothetical protein GY751_20930 [Bacteroidetes bacterium]|nr:hypothetical protein [Bacteroidota bacterium]